MRRAAAFALLALALLAAGAGPARATSLSRALGRRELAFRARAADSLVVFPDRRMLTGTDSAWVDGVPQGRGEAYRLSGDPARLRWLRRPADSSHVVIRYRFLPVALADIYQYPGVWSPAAPAPGAAAPGTEAAAGATMRPASTGAAGTGEAFGRFSISGSKTLAFEVGTNRDMAVRQSLDLSLGGEVGRDLSVVAILSDRNLPITPEGRTQDLGNLDKVVVEVKSPRFGASLGDYDLRMDSGEYASMMRTVQGARVRALVGDVDVEGAAALGKGVFLSRQFLGEEGRQGPYRLTDPSGQPDVSVVPGSEQVWLDGEKMRRGDNADYTVDYARGEISFTARRPIHPGSRIAVDYQFAADQFRRNVSATRAAFQLGQAGTMQVAWMREADDPSHPLGAALSAEDLAALAAAPAGGTVTTDGAHYMGPGKGDYRKIAPGTPEEHFQYAGRDSGEYQVDFMASRQGPGSYVDSVVAGGLAYAWRGAGLGSYVPGRALPVPASHSVADVGGRVRYGILSLAGEGAFSVRDGNLLSAGSSSTGAAWNVAMVLAGSDSGRAGGGGGAGSAGNAGVPGAVGRGARGSRGITLELRARREEEHFEPLGRTLAPFVEEEWNLAATDRAGGRTVLTSALRYGLDPGTSFGLELGSWKAGGGRDARRATWTGRHDGALRWQASWAAVSNRDSLGEGSGSRRRGEFSAALARGALRPEAHWNHDAVRDSAGADRSGYDDYGVGLKWTSPRGMSLNAGQVWRRDFGTGLGSRDDPLRSSTQQLAVAYAGSPDWTLAGSLSQRLLSGAADSLGATRNGQVQFLLHREALDGEARYEISATRSVARGRQVTFVGPGLGAYDSLGTYVGRGDYTVSYYGTGVESPASQSALNARLEWSGERAGRDDWLRQVALRGEAQATRSTRRTAAGGLGLWPGSIPDDPDVLSGNGVFRQDVEWNDAGGRGGVRLRYEWTGSADRQYSSYEQVRRARTGSGRVRLAGRGGTSLEVESRLRRRETALGPPGQATSYLSRGTDTNVSLKWVPSTDWSATLNGRLLSERDDAHAATSRQVELSPAVAFSRGGRFRAELKGTRVTVSEEGSIVPGFDNYGTLLRTRTEHDLTLSYQVQTAVQLSLFAHGTRPDGGRWIETARLEMRALF